MKVKILQPLVSGIYGKDIQIVFYYTDFLDPRWSMSEVYKESLSQNGLI